jgi:outer membrane protein assembly factor BamB
MLAAALGLALLVGCGKPPLVPATPTGPTLWMKGVAIVCSTSTTDPGGSQVSYQFDWGDNSQSQWSEFVEGDVAFGDTHTYIEAGSYDIRARAKNKKRASAWSDVLRVTVGVGEGQVLWSFGYTDPESVEDSADFSLGCFAIGPDKTAWKGCIDYGAVIGRKSSGGRLTFITGEDMEEFYGSPVVADDGAVYIGCYNDSLYAINPTGTKKWARYMANSVGGGGALAADGAVVFQNEDSLVVCFAPDGTPRWSFFSRGGNSSPAIGPDGTVYFASEDGYLYALKGTGTLAASPWPKFHHDLRNTGRVGGGR